MTTPRIRGASARDVETAREIMQLVLTATVERIELRDRIAAALSERERETVERIARYVEENGHPPKWKAVSLARAIRADAARRSETP